jgi:hypothetical protein
MSACTDMNDIHNVKPSPRGCEDCLKTGDECVRSTCVHAGCRDSSKNNTRPNNFIPFAVVSCDARARRGLEGLLCRPSCFGIAMPTMREQADSRFPKLDGCSDFEGFGFRRTTVCGSGGRVIRTRRDKPRHLRGGRREGRDRRMSPAATDAPTLTPPPRSFKTSSLTNV